MRFFNKLSFLICSLLALQACHTSDLEDAEVLQKQQIAQAATYNFQLGLAYLNQGDIPRAKKKMMQALNQAPNSPEVNAAMGYYMEKTAEFDEARRYYTKAISLSKNSGAQLNNYGTFLCRQQQYSMAEKYFMKAVHDIHYEHTAGAYENAGLCAIAAKKYAKAHTYFIKALASDPTKEQSLYEILKFDIKNRDYEEAYSYVKKYNNLIINNIALLAFATKIANIKNDKALEAQYQIQKDKLSARKGDLREQ